jgi:hypothetical protein
MFLQRLHASPRGKKFHSLTVPWIITREFCVTIFHIHLVPNFFFCLNLFRQHN